MLRPGTKALIYFAAGGAILFASSRLLVPLNEQRKREKLEQPPVPREMQASLVLSPLLALGRAPLVDYLWLRATKLKEEGRYFDAYQLSRRICDLQPKFAAVWGFLGWNMAYNISVALKSPEERWRWVKNGYELIRDKGIPLNPTNTQLYRELSWILFHKVGDFMDEMHSYYKLQFATQMEDILGPPPDGFVRPGVPAGDYYRDYPFDSLAAAPQKFDELLKVPANALLVDKLKTWGLDVSQPGVFLGLLGGLKEDRFQIPNAKPGEQATRLHDLKEFMKDPALADARTALEKYWRSWRLQNEVRLDPQRIITLQKGFGLTMDFRLPEAHALYWANMGMEKGVDNKARLDIHRLNTNRIEFFCLQKMFHRGRLTMSPNAKLGEPPLLSPDVRVVPAMFNAFMEDSKEYLKDERQKTPVSENFKTTFIGFMRTAILRYHELGMMDKADELFKYLKEHFPDPFYENGLDGFLEKQFAADRDLNDYRIALARIESLLIRGVEQLSVDDDDQAQRLIASAKRVYELYQKSVISNRQRLPDTLPQILRRIVHEYGGRLDRASYVHVCEKLGIEPLKESTTQPAGSPS
jgi:hypothetical protein